MKRTKKSKIMCEKEKSAGRALLINSVIAYHSHLKEWAQSVSNYALLTYCHPLDRESLAKGVGIKYSTIYGYGVN